MPSATDLVTARDGSRRLVRRWSAPAAGPVVAHVLIVHGLGEHSGRYERVGEWLSAAGVQVHAYDQLGFGGSDGARADLDRWSRLHDDLEDRLTAVRRDADGRPVVLYGHSMGGLVVLGYVLDGRPAPDLLVLSAPGLDSAIPPWKRLLARALAPAAPALTVANGVSGEILSRDPAVAARYRADPLNVHRSTLRFGSLGFAEQARVRRALGDLAVPTYVFHGGEDRLVPPEASEPLAANPRVTRVVHQGLRHETHNEPEGEAVVARVAAWIGNEVAGAGMDRAGD